eukprot:1541858-Pyramimonas_sp.AAC.1
MSHHWSADCSTCQRASRPAAARSTGCSALSIIKTSATAGYAATLALAPPGPKDIRPRNILQKATDSYGHTYVYTYI